MHESLSAHVQGQGARLVFACHVGEAVEGTVVARNEPAPPGVRFIHVRPPDWYLTLAEGPDGLDGPAADQWGWDLRKVLRLLLRSNPLVWSWLSSPDVLADREGLGAALRDLAQAGYSRRALGHALWGESRKALTAFLDRGEAMTATKSLKAARALLALRWLETRATLPPLALDALMDWARRCCPTMSAPRSTPSAPGRWRRATRPSIAGSTRSWTAPPSAAPPCRRVRPTRPPPRGFTAPACWRTVAHLTFPETTPKESPREPVRRSRRYRLRRPHPNGWLPG